MEFLRILMIYVAIKWNVGGLHVCKGFKKLTLTKV